MCGFNINKGQRSTWINFQWPSDTGIEQISVHSAKNQHHQRKPHIFHHATGTTIRQTGQNQNAGTTWSTRNLSEPLIGFASDLGASKPTHMPTNHNLVTPKANPFNTWLRVNSQPTFFVDQKMKKKTDLGDWSHQAVQHHVSWKSSYLRANGTSDSAEKTRDTHNAV